MNKTWQAKLVRLFRAGHTPKSALTCLRMDLEDSLDEGEGLEQTLANRALCPDYRHCHYLFRKVFTEQYNGGGGETEGEGGWLGRRGWRRGSGAAEGRRMGWSWKMLGEGKERGSIAAVGVESCLLPAQAEGWGWGDVAAGGRRWGGEGRRWRR